VPLILISILLILITEPLWSLDEKAATFEVKEVVCLRGEKDQEKVIINRMRHLDGWYYQTQSTDQDFLIIYSEEVLLPCLCHKS